MNALFSRNRQPLTGADWENSGAKVATDRAFGVAAVGALAVPAMVAAAKLYRADGGPLTYNQPRDHNAAGDSITIHKIRSMGQDADKHAPSVVNKQDDPRIIAGMKWARDSGVDEFPQLLQTLLPKNHPDRLAFVGRRAMDDKDRERMHTADPIMYKDWEQSADTILKASVMGRGGLVAHQYDVHDATYQRARMQAEIYQAENASFEEDTKIVWETAVLMGNKIGERLVNKLVILQGDGSAAEPTYDPQEVADSPLWTPDEYGYDDLDLLALRQPDGQQAI